MSSHLLTLLSLAFAGGSITKLHNAAAQRGADPVPTGKLWRIVRTGRVTVLVALLLGLSLPGWAAAAQTQPTGSATRSRTPRPDPGRVWLRIMAFTDAPVVGADVRVSVHGSQGRPLVEVLAATNDQGVFPVEVPRHLSFFQVSISSGTTNGNPFAWHLSADVVLTDPAHQIVVVNPVTTLVSRVLDRRRDFNIPDRDPKLELDDAEALVRRFLGLPANYNLGMALRESSGYASPFFSPSALLTEAQMAGGLDAFVHLLLQELASPSATHSFRKPQGLLGSAATSMGTSLANGALSYVGGQGAGWVMAYTGLAAPGNTDSAEIASLQQALLDLTSAITNLSSQVAQLAQQVSCETTQDDYQNITNDAQQLEDKVESQESDLSYFASQCPPLPSSSDGTVAKQCDPSDPTSFYSTNQPIVNGELATEYSAKYYEGIEGEVNDNGATAFEGLLHLFSKQLGQCKPFFRPADSTNVQNLYNYWDNVLTAAANMRMEYFHEYPQEYQNSTAGQGLITAFMGDPNLSPPTPGTFQNNETANQKLMFPAVPAGTVISTVDHTMWSLNPWSYPSPLNPAANCSQHSQVPGFTQNPKLNSFAGFSNWQRDPTYAQWQAAVKLAPTSSSGTSWVWMQWLIAQTNTTSSESPASLGFFNLQGCGLGLGGGWSQTPTSSGSSVVYAIQLDKSNLTTINSSLGNTWQGYDWPTRTLASGEQYFWYQ